MPLPLPRRATLLLVLLAGCGESWTWDVGADAKDTAVAVTHDVDRDGYTDFSAGGDDCDDTDAAVNPAAAEVWYDDVDQNCAGDDDFDQDADAHRSATHADRTGALGDDCYDALDDAYPSGAASCPREADLPPGDVYPGAADLEYDGTDADCSGNDDFDQDGDGFGRCAECDDSDAAIYPNDEPDVWYDGVDANCDGNDGDQDGDGYYTEGYPYTIPADFEAGDCDDSAATTFPGAPETWYDGVDADCAGDDDFDQDGDGFVAAAWGGDDCDDVEANTYPGAVDAWYDGVDSDCAGNDDFDQDGDGAQGTDWGGDDCDDVNASVNPAALEDCSTVADDDCDGDTNDVGATGCSEWYEDADGDGYGGGSACMCLSTATYSIGAGADCDDGDLAVNPAATEVCNDGVDNDCDGGAGGCGLTGGSLSGADAIYTGEAAGDYAGYSVAGAGDVNGDGFDDFLVGAPTANGAAYLILGSASPSGGSLSAAVQYRGETVDNRAGLSVAGAGDVDGDGLDDFVVGAPGNYDVTYGSGAAYLVLGSASPSSVTLASAFEYTGQAMSDNAGLSVSGAGDVDGDGFNDFLVGAPYNNSAASDAGAAYLVLGSASPSSASLTTKLVFTGEAANDWAFVCAEAGDTDGDGLDDFLVGAQMNQDGGGGAGAVYLVLGGPSPTGGSLSAAIEYTGAATEYVGARVSGAGDVNSDGFADFLAGHTSGAYLVLGSATPTGGSLSGVIDLETVAGEFGTPATAGDVDDDGFADVLIGSENSSTAAAYAGAAYLLYGSAAPSSVAVSSGVEFTGEAATDFAGYGLAGAGDVNADGFADVLVGSYGSDSGSADAGAAYLLLGKGGI